MKAWTTGELRRLRELTVEAGPNNRLGPRAIVRLGEFPGRTNGSIRHAMNFYGLADPTKSELSKVSLQLTKAQKKELEEFLQTTGKYWPSPAVGKEFGISETTVLRYRRQLELKFSHQESLQDPVYREWWQNNRANRRTSYREGREVERKRMSELLEGNKWIFWEPDSPPEKRQCKVCGAILWATDEFFRRFPTKLRNGTPTTYLSSICLACPKKATRRIPRSKANGK